MTDRDTITLPREVVELALDALEWSWGGEPMGTKEREAITALRTHLAAEPTKPEPVAWGVRWKNTDGVVNATTDPQLAHEWRRNQVMEVLPLYTAPPEDEALRRDAERYRWLRDNAAGFSGKTLDAAIDAAMGDRT